MSLAKFELLYNLLIRKGVIKVFKLLLLIYITLYIFYLQFLLIFTSIKSSLN